MLISQQFALKIIKFFQSMYNNENDVVSFIAHKSLYSCHGILGLNAMYINNKYKLDIKGTSYNDRC